MGGAVNGGRFYGTAPHVSIETDDQVGQGRLLPSYRRGSVRGDARAVVRLHRVGAPKLPFLSSKTALVIRLRIRVPSSAPLNFCFSFREVNTILLAGALPCFQRAPPN